MALPGVEPDIFGTAARAQNHYTMTITQKKHLQVDKLQNGLSLKMYLRMYNSNIRAGTNTKKNKITIPRLVVQEMLY